MRRLILMLAAVTCLICFATPARAENDYGEDTRLKGRNVAGAGIAAFYNNLDKPSKRALHISIGVVILFGAVVAVRHFVRESKDALTPRQKQPWEVG